MDDFQNWIPRFTATLSTKPRIVYHHGVYMIIGFSHIRPEPTISQLQSAWESVYGEP